MSLPHIFPTGNYSIISPHRPGSYFGAVNLGVGNATLYPVQLVAANVHPIPSWTLTNLDNGNILLKLNGEFSAVESDYMLWVSKDKSASAQEWRLERPYFQDGHQRYRMIRARYNQASGGVWTAPNVTSESSQALSINWLTMPILPPQLPPSQYLMQLDRMD